MSGFTVASECASICQFAATEDAPACTRHCRYRQEVTAEPDEPLTDEEVLNASVGARLESIESQLAEIFHELIAITQQLVILNQSDTQC